MFFGEPGKDGKRGPYAFTKVWNDTKLALGMADLRFHDRRHEAVIRLVEAGFSDQEVSAISGHKSMQMLKRYTHLRAEDLVGRLDNVQRKLPGGGGGDHFLQLGPEVHAGEVEADRAGAQLTAPAGTRRHSSSDNRAGVVALMAASLIDSVAEFDMVEDVDESASDPQA